MALVFDRTAQSTGGSTTTISYNVSCNGTDRLMLAFIGYGGSPLRTVTAITYGGTAMTLLPGGSVHDGVGRGVITYYLINPKIGDNTFTVTLSASTFQVAAGLIFYMGAHQTAPIGAVVTNFSTTTTVPTVSVSSSAGRVSVAGCVSDANTSMAITTGTSRIPINNFGGFCYDIGTLDGGGTIGWTYSGADPGWAIAGVEIIPSDCLDSSQGDAFRFYPRLGQEGRVQGAVIEGTSDGDPVTGPYTTLATTPTGGNWTTQYYQMTGLNLGTYRYLRCRLGAGCYGNVSEIEFYKAGVKVTGTGFGSPGSFGGSGNTFDKALDGNTATAFDAPNPDNQYIGIDRGGPAQDSFNRPDSADIGTNWTMVTGSTAMKIVSNQIQPSAIGSAAAEYWNVDTFTADMWSEVKVTNCAGAGTNAYSGCGAAVRVSTSANTYYAVMLNNGTGAMSVAKFVNGTFTVLYIIGEGPVPKTIRLEAEGNIIRGFKNGVLSGGIQDNSITTGTRTGVSFRPSAGITAASADDWAAGNLAGTSLMGPVRSVMVGAKSLAANGNMTLVMPAGVQNDDILIAAVSSADNVASSLSGWTLIQEDNNGTTLRLTSWWFRYAGTTPNLVVTHTGGSGIVGGITRIVGAKKTGSPINVTTLPVTVGSTSVNIPGATSTVPGCLGVTVGTANASGAKALGGVGILLLEDASDASNPNYMYLSSTQNNGVGMLEFSNPTTTIAGSSVAGIGGPCIGYMLAIEPVAVVVTGGGWFRYLSPRLVGVALGASTVVADTFNRADSPNLGTNWVSTSASNTLKIVSNAALGDTLGPRIVNWWKGTTMSDNHWTEITIKTMPTDTNSGFSPTVRVNTTLETQTYYYLWVSLGLFHIWKRVAGVDSYISEAPVSCVAGDVVRLEVNGTTLRAFWNGVLKITATDTAIATGKPGISIQVVGSLTNVAIDGWQGGET